MKMRTAYGFTILSGLLISNLASAAPIGGEVAAGAATISQAGTATTINQTSGSAVINWKGFDTASNESVVFKQPDANSTVLNRINSGAPTNFAGSLTANGKVFVVNPNGMIFAKDSTVNAASFIATTADIANEDFMNGSTSKNYKFFAQLGHETASIINNGTITVADEGLVALIAPSVVNGNSGVVQADYGVVNLAAGKSFVLDFNKDQLINFDASSVVNKARVDNAGKIQAYKGTVLMTANTVGQVLDNVINISGVIEAKSGWIGKDGEVILNANGGAIKETAVGTITAEILNTNSSTGTDLSGEVNRVSHFYALNSKSGDISLRNSQKLYIDGILQSGGNLVVVTTSGDILQSNANQGGIYVPHKSDFTAFDGSIHLDDNRNVFIDELNLRAKGDMSVMAKGGALPPNMTMEHIRPSK